MGKAKKSSLSTPKDETKTPSAAEVQDDSGDCDSTIKQEIPDDISDSNSNKPRINFHEIGLDGRLLKAITSLGWPRPTLIQEKAIPLALQGKDILSQAHTGSGKTAAYAIPIIQTLLQLKESADVSKCRALILVPSKDLSEQVVQMFSQLSVGFLDIISSLNLMAHDPKSSLKIPNATPDILVGTPSRVLSWVNSGQINLSEILWLVIDESDLILSFGYKNDIKNLVSYLPNTYQTFLTSATHGEGIDSLKNLVMKNPAVIQLKKTALPSKDQLAQYHIICESEDDKHLVLYALLKLRLLRGKAIIFVNSITRCYRLKLFLEQFSIYSCILNSELPVRSRIHTVEQFNKGLYDYIIAADENQLFAETLNTNSKLSKSRQKKSKEFSVSRGVDFQKVSNVLNFDFPETLQAYIHRVGRTARGYSSGTALSFVTGDEISLLENAQEKLGSENCMRPFQFAMKEIEGFRYRCADAMRIVTKQAIKDARLRELKVEMLNSEKLQNYFEQNPKDLNVLKHNSVLRPSKVKPHMKHVPEYLVPEALKGVLQARGKRRNSSAGRSYNKGSQLNPKYKKRREDPLTSFKYVKKES